MSDDYRRCFLEGCPARPTFRVVVYTLAIRAPHAPDDITSEHQLALYTCNDHAHPQGRLGFAFHPLHRSPYPVPPT